MADRPTTLRDDELQAFLAETQTVVAQATVCTPSGFGFRASPSASGDARVDIRTVATAVTALAEVRDFRTARALASYLLAVQGTAGAWAASYDEQGKPVAAGSEEDVTPLAIWALMRYVRASGDEAFAEQ